MLSLIDNNCLAALHLLQSQRRADLTAADTPGKVDTAVVAVASAKAFLHPVAEQKDHIPTVAVEVHHSVAVVHNHYVAVGGDLTTAAGKGSENAAGPLVNCRCENRPMASNCRWDDLVIEDAEGGLEVRRSVGAAVGSDSFVGSDCRLECRRPIRASLVDRRRSVVTDVFVGR